MWEPMLPWRLVGDGQGCYEEGHEPGLHGLEVVSENTHQDIDHLTVPVSAAWLSCPRRAGPADRR